jgi:transcriptional regulator of arginine metabolism
MQKSERQQFILDLIAAKNIGTQEELSELLEKRGFSATQSSISRDLLDLGVIKASGAYTLPQRPANADVFGILGLDMAGPNLVVAKCRSGLASAATVRIDAERIDGIVGTIAGDDTIFIAVADEKAQRLVMKKVWEVFE